MPLPLGEAKSGVIGEKEQKKLTVRTLMPTIDYFRLFRGPQASRAEGRSTTIPVPGVDSPDHLIIAGGGTLRTTFVNATVKEKVYNKVIPCAIQALIPTLVIPFDL